MHTLKSTWLVAAVISIVVSSFSILITPESVAAAPASERQWVECYDRWNGKQPPTQAYSDSVDVGALDNCFGGGLTVNGNEVCRHGGYASVPLTCEAPSQEVRNRVAAGAPGAGDTPPPAAGDNAAAQAAATNQQECEAAEGEWDAQENKCNPKSEASCKVEHGVSWIVCPIMNFLAYANDAAFGFLSEHFLEVRTDVLAGNATKEAWQGFRNIANVAFVIAFMVIVYSQITNMGISNYGIKKLLPKLILVAVVVNVSYFLCQALVDLSNYLGYSLVQFFGETMAPNITGENAAESNLGGTAVAIIAAILASGAIIFVVLGGGVLLPAVLALVMVALILITRQALIIILIVISPLAFVAYLLPNTESLFKKWWKIFYSLLLLFPVVAVVFGASQMVSMLIMDANNIEVPAPGAPMPAEFDYMAAVIALGVSALPFFAVPSILKTSLNATGALGEKLQSWSRSADKMATNAMKKNAKQRFDNSSFGRGWNNRKAAKKQFKDKLFAERMQGKGLLNKGRKLMAGGYNVHSLAKQVPGLRRVANAAEGIPILGTQLQQGEYQAAALQRQADAEMRKAESTEIAAARAKFSSDAVRSGMPIEEYLSKQYKQAVKSGDSIGARAALSAMYDSGASGVEAANEALVSTAGTMNRDMKDSIRHHILDNHSDIKGKDARQTAWAGSNDDSQLIATSLRSGLSDEMIANQTASHRKNKDTGELMYDQNGVPIWDGSLAAGLSMMDTQEAAKTAKRVLANPETESELKGEARRVLEHFASLDDDNNPPTAGQPAAPNGLNGTPGGNTPGGNPNSPPSPNSPPRPPSPPQPQPAPQPQNPPASPPPQPQPQPPSQPDTPDISTMPPQNGPAPHITDEEVVEGPVLPPQPPLPGERGDNG